MERPFLITLFLAALLILILTALFLLIVQPMTLFALRRELT